MRTWEPEEAPQVGFSRQGAPSKGRTSGRAGPDHPSKEIGNFHRIEHFNPRGGDRAGACGSA